MWIFSLFLHTPKSDIKKPAFDTVVKLWLLVRRRIKPLLTCEPKSRNSKIREYLWARTPDYYSSAFATKASIILPSGTQARMVSRKQIKMGTRWHGLALRLKLWSKHHTHFQLWSRHLQGEGLGTWVRSLWHRDDLSKVMLGFSTNYAPFLCWTGCNWPSPICFKFVQISTMLQECCITVTSMEFSLLIM